MRMITKDIGRPLEDVRSLRQFLCVMYDSCVVQRNLYRKCRILHRDISDANIMIAPDTDEYRQRCAEGYAAVKFVNQVLAKCKDAKPNPACLVIDLGNGADLKVERGQNELTVRTGTPKFIARSISCGRLLDPDDFDSHTAKMPSMEGTLGDYSQFMHTAGYEVLDASEAATQSQVKFTHRLFHDAESTFWVIAWALARSTGGGPESEQGPHPYFSKFFYTMYRHHPEPLYDSREDLGRPSEGYWRSVLHPDLGILARMLKQMFTYIRPEWGYCPELDPEHVHEALMRSLLAEIIRIDETGTDIPIAIGGRAIPPALGTMLPLSSSTMGSLSKAASNSQKSLPTRSEQNSVNGSELGGAGSLKKQSKSCQVEPQMPDISHGLQQLKLGLDVTTGEVLEQSTAQGVSLEWKLGTHKLLAVPLGERL
ncbi:hypothetical protein OPQ81_009125 [Rhizoctonia solani]|nr:hypothetical protein OPQ81_009125 [Rhizoctonia solani]